MGVPVAAHTGHTCALGSPSTGLPWKYVGPSLTLHPHPPMMANKADHGGLSVALVATVLAQDGSCYHWQLSHALSLLKPGYLLHLVALCGHCDCTLTTDNPNSYPGAPRPNDALIAPRRRAHRAK